MSSPTGHTIVPGDASAANQATANAALAAIQAAVEILDNIVAGSEAQVDVVTSALPTGASTEAKQSTIATTLSDIKTAVELLDNAIDGTEMQVDIVSAAVSSVPGTEALFDFLAYESGTGSGDDMNIDGSTPGVYSYKAPSGKVVYVSRINFIITDGNIKPDSFGGISALANGCLVKHTSSASVTILDFLAGATLKTNSDFAWLAGADIQPVSGTSVDSLPVRWTLDKAFAGRAFKLADQEKIQLTIQDDLTGLTSFRAMIQGWIVDA